MITTCLSSQLGEFLEILCEADFRFIFNQDKEKKDESKSTPSTAQTPLSVIGKKTSRFYLKNYYVPFEK